VVESCDDMQKQVFKFLKPGAENGEGLRGDLPACAPGSASLGFSSSSSTLGSLTLSLVV